jgi:hypothetical protein
MDVEHAFDDLANLQKAAAAQVLSLVKYRQENEAQIQAQLLSFAEWMREIEAQIQAELRPFVDFVQSEEGQAIIRQSISRLAQVDWTNAVSNVERLHSSRLGADMQLPDSAAEPILKSRREIGFGAR